MVARGRGWCVACRMLGLRVWGGGVGVGTPVSVLGGGEGRGGRRKGS